MIPGDDEELRLEERKPRASGDDPEAVIRRDARLM